MQKWRRGGGMEVEWNSGREGQIAVLESVALGPSDPLALSSRLLGWKTLESDYSK